MPSRLARLATSSSSASKPIAYAELVDAYPSASTEPRRNVSEAPSSTGAVASVRSPRTVVGSALTSSARTRATQVTTRPRAIAGSSSSGPMAVCGVNTPTRTACLDSRFRGEGTSGCGADEPELHRDGLDAELHQDGQVVRGQEALHLGDDTRLRLLRGRPVGVHDRSEEGPDVAALPVPVGRAHRAAVPDVEDGVARE